MNNRFTLHTEKKYMRLIRLVLFLAAIYLTCLLMNQIFISNAHQEQLLIENAVEKSVTQCYALEGAYPVNLDYLKENYGLSYNTAHFIVDYQYIGGNIRPDITIIPKKSDSTKSERKP